MNSEELDDDLMTVLWVCEATWTRYLDLVGKSIHVLESELDVSQRYLNTSRLQT